MIRTALDSDVLDMFTTNTDFILTYTDLVTDPATFEAKYPAQQVAYIDRKLGDPGGKATIIDIEPGAWSPSEVVAWYEERFHRGIRWLTHYSDRNDLPAIKAALAGRAMWEWVATLDGTAHIDGYAHLRGPSLIQVLGETQLGFHADFSLVLDPNWRPSPASLHVDAVINTLQSSARNLGAASTSVLDAVAALRLLA